MSALPVLGIVLAGGGSTRMGTDKAQLVFEGETLLDRARRILAGTGCAHVRVGGRPGETDGIADREPGGGPGRGLLDALTLAASLGLDGVLAIPVDTPLLGKAQLQPLMEAPRERARAWRGHPLPVFLPASRALTARCDVGSVRSLIEAGRAEWLEAGASVSAGLINVNAPEDFEALCRRRPE